MIGMAIVTLDVCSDYRCLDEVPNIASKRDGIMIRLLDSAIRLLEEQGMSRLLVDAVKGGDDGFQSMGESPCQGSPSIQLLTSASLGFQKWARYRDVWRNV